MMLTLTTGVVPDPDRARSAEYPVPRTSMADEPGEVFPFGFGVAEGAGEVGAVDGEFLPLIYLMVKNAPAATTIRISSPITRKINRREPPFLAGGAGGPPIPGGKPGAPIGCPWKPGCCGNAPGIPGCGGPPIGPPGPPGGNAPGIPG